MEGKDPRASEACSGVDVDIRSHNREALDNHPLRFKMELIEGSSIDPVTFKVSSIANNYSNVLHFT